MKTERPAAEEKKTKLDELRTVHEPKGDTYAEPAEAEKEQEFVEIKKKKKITSSKQGKGEEEGKDISQMVGKQ